MKISYNKMRKLRELILDEVRAQFGGVITIDHYILAEHRLQSALMAEIDDKEVEKEKPDFNKKQ